MASHNEILKQFIEAAKDGDLETVRRFVQRENVNVEARNEGGWTALIFASHRGHQEVVELLLDNDANVNAADYYDGSTALMLASEGGCKEAVEMLLDNDANVNARDDYGNTALLCASIHNHKEIVEMLLERNAETNIVNTWNMTALDCAKRHGHSEIVVLILDYEIAQLEDKLDRGMSPQDTKTKNQELLKKVQLRKQYKMILKREKESHSDSSRPQKRSRLRQA